MTRHRVLISADAEGQLAAIRAWWLENRPAAPDLFDRELDAAVATIANVPGAFPVYQQDSDAEIRRALLPRSRYALYFSIEPELVLIVAIWHTARANGPPL